MGELEGGDNRGARRLCRIARTYHAWRGEQAAGAFEDIPGFCKGAALEEIRRREERL